MTPFYVTKCVCHKKSFRDIIDFAQSNGLHSVEDLREEQYCSTKCKMCEPYIETALQTGEVSFKPGFYNNRKMSS